MAVLFVNMNETPRCGVADYAQKLCRHAVMDGDGTYVLSNRIRSWWGLFGCVRPYQAVVFQYPARLYSHSLLPVFFFAYCRLMGVGVCLNLHENAEARPQRRVINLALARLASKVVTTSPHELASLPVSLQKKAVVNTIGPNITTSEPDIFSWRRSRGPFRRIMFFGLIKRSNGISRFVELAERFAASRCGKTQFVLVGSVVDREYYLQLQAVSDRINMELLTELPEDEVSRQLKLASYAYLWYPDGVSERRGAFLACINHGLIVFSNRGRQTPSSLLPAFIDMEQAAVDEAIERFERSRSAYEQFLTSLEGVSKEYDWDVIGRKFREWIA